MLLSAGLRDKPMHSVFLIKAERHARSEPLRACTQSSRDERGARGPFAMLQQHTHSTLRPLRCSTEHRSLLAATVSERDSTVCTLPHRPHHMCACAVTFKVVTLGESRVGKTSLVLRFSRDTFDTQEPSTIGVSYVPITMCVTCIGCTPPRHVSCAARRSHGDSNVKLQIWDTCGQELYASLLTSYYRDAAAALLVYDVCTPHSFSRMQAWANGERASVGGRDSRTERLTLRVGAEIRDKAPSNMGAQCAAPLGECGTLTLRGAVVTIAGNKIDLREAKVPRAQAERFAREIGAELVFTSAKTGEGELLLEQRCTCTYCRAGRAGVREAFHSLGRRVMEKLTAGGA